MANPPRDTERLQLRLERRLAEPLRREVERRKMVNLQALITKVLEDFVDSGCQDGASIQKKGAPEIDLRSLLMEAHKANAEANRTISELSRTIATLTEERKNAVAEPARGVESTGSTASPTAQRGRTNVIAGLRQGSPA